MVGGFYGGLRPADREFQHLRRPEGQGQMIRTGTIDAVGRTYRHARRYSAILSVLMKYGFGDLVDTLNIREHVENVRNKVSRQRAEPVERLSRPERVRMVLEELGPTFVKMGQILSTRADLVPLEYVREMSKLQDAVPAFPYENVKEIILAETGKAPGAIFHVFQRKPIAAASIGQVHRAVLKDTGQEVAVKIQRPDIQRTVEVDLDILRHLATLLERHVAELKLFHPAKIVNEFARTMEDEMDYRVEASHIERFAQQCADDHTMYVPKVFRELTTRRMLVMEFIHGIKASDFVALGKGGYDLKEVASRGADSMLQQICTWGFYHADPHPGNILVLPNNVVCFIDFGMMGRISRQEREDFTDFVEVLIRKDDHKAGDALLKLTDGSVDPKNDELRRDLLAFMDRYAYLPLKELDMGKMLQSIVEILRKQGISLKTDLFLMVKALTIAEGVGRSLDPEFEIMGHAEPFFRRIRLTRYSFQGLTTDLVDTGTQWYRFVRDIPAELKELLRKASEGKLKLDIEYGALEHTLLRLDLISGRIASAIVLASLIIGSSIIVLSNTPPKWHEMPVIGLAGLFIAALMGLWLLTSFFHRRH